jgi:hypothetical protein
MQGPCEVLSLLCVHRLHPLASNISIYFSQTNVPIRTKLDRHVAWIVAQLFERGCHGHHRMVAEFTTTYVPMQSVPITTNIVSLNPVHSEVYSIQQ